MEHVQQKELQKQKQHQYTIESNQKPQNEKMSQDHQ